MLYLIRIELSGVSVNLVGFLAKGSNLTSKRYKKSGIYNHNIYHTLYSDVGKE